MAGIFGRLANNEGAQQPIEYDEDDDGDDSEEFEDIGVISRPTEPVSKDEAKPQQHTQTVQEVNSPEPEPIEIEEDDESSEEELKAYINRN